MPQKSWAAVVGYDPEILSKLHETPRRTLEWLAEAWLLSTGVLGISFGYGAWLIGHSFVGAALASVGMGLFVLNLLRLAAAGAGAAPHLGTEEVRNYRPAWGASLFVAFLALLMAQLAQLPLHRATLDPVVAAHRAELASEHARGRSALGLAHDGRYTQELARSEFLVLRLRAMWQRPDSALRYTIVYCLLVLAPTFLVRFMALGALRAYERIRHQAQRRLIGRESRETRALVESSLASWPTFRAMPARFSDGPFDLVVVSPLLQAPRLPARGGFWNRLGRLQ